MPGKSLKYIDFDFSFLFNENTENYYIQVKDRIGFDLSSSQLALEVCRIYSKFERSDEFCVAVSKEDHFYSQELFDITIQKVLNGKEISNKSNDNFMLFIFLEQIAE